MLRNFKKFFADSRGVTAIEYGLIASLVAVAAIGAFSAVGDRLNVSMTGISKRLR